MARRPTKYAHVVGDLPQAPDSDSPDRIALKQKLKEEIVAPWDPARVRPFLTVSELMRAGDQIVEELCAGLKNIPKGNKSIPAITKGYTIARLVKDNAAGWLASIQLLVDTYEMMMIGAMKDEKIRAIDVDGIGSVSISEEPQGKVVNKEAFRLWCMAPADRCMICGGESHEHSELEIPIPEGRHNFKPGGGLANQLQLWPSSMNTLAKERCLQGDEPPDGVETYAWTKILFRQS